MKTLNPAAVGIVLAIIGLPLTLFGQFELDQTQLKTPFEFRDNERVAFVGGSLAERMNLFGNFEAMLHARFPEKKLVIRNFGWPADEVGVQQRPDNYTVIDHPMEVFGPELFFCFFGFNEHFAGDLPEALASFKERYRKWINDHKKKYSKQGREAKFVLISPIATEGGWGKHLPDADSENEILAKYVTTIGELATEMNLPYVDVFAPTSKLFVLNSGPELTINNVHLNEEGDSWLARMLDERLFKSDLAHSIDWKILEPLKNAVNDKSWYHLQDYRMLNGWYVYGGRRTWDTETFPGEFQKIRKMVAVRDQYIWDIATGNEVPDKPDDSGTGENFIPETMFGTRDDNFRSMREPKTLKYPTPEESIAQMDVPDGFEVQLFASEREFPEFANPTQMTFDSKGRLWVSCMINYPQWLPGSAKPGDKLLIFEDTDHDGKADVCKTFYDKLICPTGFEFYEDGVLVIDEPRILFLKDTDGDDKADSATQVLDGIATDDTHHAMGAWEWSHGGLLYMLEGIAMSTTLETPWGPFRNKGPSGAYVLDPKSWKIRYFKTPGYGNPWCMVFDRWGMGIIGDGTGAQQHWASPLSGYNVASRKTLEPIFNNEGMRPAVGSEFLLSRHFPDEMQGQFTYSCVINMHGMPRFEVNDDPKSAGMIGKRIDDLITSTDNFFRPVDAQIGPDGALWFGDWCNALIGHMQYSQRDPNRDHEHGRVYRLVNKNKPLIEPQLQADATIEELLEQLTAYELRTRYRARRELWMRDKDRVYSAIDKWLNGSSSDEQLCEALWIQERFRDVRPELVARLMQSTDFHVRASAVHTVSNEMSRFASANVVFTEAVADEHPRVRLEGLRALSFLRSASAVEIALRAIEKPMDYWIEYTLEHTLQALRPFAEQAQRDGTFLANASDKAKKYYEDYVLKSGPGGKAVKPLAIAHDPERPQPEKDEAVETLTKLSGGKFENGSVVYERTCSSCHKITDRGKEFGPALDGVGARYTRAEIIKHILWPNEKITKGYETVRVLTLEGKVLNGFILDENDSTLSLGVASDDGKGLRVDLNKDDIDERREMNASSMPEGLVQTIAPSEFLDLIQFLGEQLVGEDGWIATGQGTVGELRTHGELVEISRDAQIQIGADFPKRWNQNVHLTLSAAGNGDNEFAFHSPEPPIANPSVIVRLAKPSEIRCIQLQNRRNKTFHERAKNLSVWISDNGDDWTMVWQAEKPSGGYSIDLPAGTRGQFIKVGLDGTGIFHLSQIVVFGPK